MAKVSNEGDASNAPTDEALDRSLSKDVKDFTNEDFPWINSETWAIAHRMIYVP